MADERTDDQLFDFLLSLGTDEVAHTGHDFLTHLKSVKSTVEGVGGDREMARAGLFHSIYGTQGFQDFSLPLEERAQVRGLIGDRAEFTAYCNCVMDRATFDAAVAQAVEGDGDAFEIRDREGSPPIALTRAQFTDLAEVHVCDWLEQVERSTLGWDYRRPAYRQMAELVGPRIVALYDAVFAREGSSTPV